MRKTLAPMSSERKNDFSHVVRLIPLRIATLALDISANVTGRVALCAQMSIASIPGLTLSTSSSVEAENGRILGFAPKNSERKCKLPETTFEHKFMLFEAIRVFRNDDRSNIIGIQMISFLVVSVSSSLEDFVSLCLRVFVMRMKGLNLFECFFY